MADNTLYPNNTVQVSNFPATAASEATQTLILETLEAGLEVQFPDGLATTALQATGNTSLSSINTKLSQTLNVSGTVAVSNLPTTQPISGTVTVSNLIAGALEASLQTLIGKHIANTATFSISPNVALVSQQIIGANLNRKGLIIYNNGANSIYLSYGTNAASSSVNMTRILATFAQFEMTFPIYTGAIQAIRNAGSGTCLITELT